MTSLRDTPAAPPRGSCWGADGIYYPAEEERKVPLTEAALDLMVYLRFALRCLLYAREELVHVAADLFVYYEPHNPRKKVAPDVAVTYGVPQEPRRAVFRTWEEGARPSFVAEISSADSRGEDRGFKFALYRDVLGCREYLIYDEASDRLDLFRREGEALVPVEPDEQGRLYSEELGCWFAREPGILVRVFDPLGQPVPSEWEQKRRADALAAEVERLRALLAEKQS